MDIKWHQQQGIKKEQDVYVPQKSYDEANSDVAEAAATVEMKTKFLETLRQRLKALEEEADTLRQAMAKQEREIRVVQVPLRQMPRIVVTILKRMDFDRTRHRSLEGQTGGSAVAVKVEPKVEIKEEPKEDSDARSIFVGNCKKEVLSDSFEEIGGIPVVVDYACTPEQVQLHFQSCGTINRVTVMTDTFGRPKGFAYVEFVEIEAVQNALLLNETELCGRLLKVCVKRTNIPGMNLYRGYGSFPRFKRSVHYKPY
ncbi:polyadenylate-binding protein 1 [Striga asiatica]|uniref:Polyadenylate-binding protein 1 n=1 Tax=Striga asiatica TaxID=4170 RepID=A0A5A7PHA4_STRAF|nr:polyadenylate-binding protein 1 [Striga asiatica]